MSEPTTARRRAIATWRQCSKGLNRVESSSSGRLPLSLSLSLSLSPSGGGWWIEWLVLSGRYRHRTERSEVVGRPGETKTGRLCHDRPVNLLAAHPWSSVRKKQSAVDVRESESVKCPVEQRFSRHAAAGLARAFFIAAGPSQMDGWWGRIWLPAAGL